MNPKVLYLLEELTKEIMRTNEEIESIGHSPRSIFLDGQSAGLEKAHELTKLIFEVKK